MHHSNNNKEISKRLLVKPVIISNALVNRFMLSMYSTTFKKSFARKLIILIFVLSLGRLVKLTPYSFGTLCTREYIGNIHHTKITVFPNMITFDIYRGHRSFGLVTTRIILSPVKSSIKGIPG